MGVTESKSVRQTGCTLEEVSSVKRNNAARTKRRVEIQSHWKASMCAKMGRRASNEPRRCVRWRTQTRWNLWKDSGECAADPGSREEMSEARENEDRKNSRVRRKTDDGTGWERELGILHELFWREGRRTLGDRKQRSHVIPFFPLHCDKAILELPW